MYLSYEDLGILIGWIDLRNIDEDRGTYHIPGQVCDEENDER